MTQYNNLNVKLSNSYLHKLKSAIKNWTQVTLNLLSNVVGDPNDENDFPPKLSYTLIHKFQGFVKLLQIILWLI